MRRPHRRLVVLVVALVLGTPASAGLAGGGKGQQPPVSTGLPPAYPVRDLLSGEKWTWRIGRNYVKLGPGKSHLLRIGG